MKKITLFASMAALALLLATAVFAGGLYGSHQKMDHQQMSEVWKSCPVGLKEAKAEVQKVGQTTAIDYTVASSEVGILKTRINSFAEQFNGQSRLDAKISQKPMPSPSDRTSMERSGMWGDKVKSERMSSEKTFSFPAAFATVAQIDNGVRLILVPADQSELGQLNDAAKQYAESINNGQCPILEKEAS